MRTLEKPQACWNCGEDHDATTVITPGVSRNVRVTEGDFGLCYDCGEWAVVAADGALRKPSDEELIAIGNDKNSRLAREAWVALKSESPVAKFARELHDPKLPDKAVKLIAKMAKVLKGQPPTVQGAALAEATAMWLNGHHPAALRKELLIMHTKMVRVFLQLEEKRENADVS